ncbi:hypothetical protein D8T65_23730 [Vibrio vulnificus]|nr:hypothetical protein D8T65_23730 [Vibrio vulnificus]
MHCVIISTTSANFFGDVGRLSFLCLEHCEQNSVIYYPYTHNAQLRGEQRLHPNLKYCAINTKTEVEAKVPSVENPS